MSDQNPTKKEAYDLKKAEEAKRSNNLRRLNLLKRTFLWAGVTALIGGSVWGLAKIAPTPENPEDAILAEAASPSDWVKGNAESKIILVEYSDFQCPACGAYYPLLEKLVQEEGDNFQFVYRHFPLPQHTNAKGAAYAAEAAGRQGKFWEMHSMIFESQAQWSNISVKNADKMFGTFAVSLNLDMEQFEKDRKSEEVKNKVEKDYESGVASKVNATPTFFLNGQKIQPRNYGELADSIKQANAANL